MADPVLPPIDYTARDYLSTREALIARIPTLMPEWTSRSSSDFGMVMIELFAAAADNLAFYADRVINESHLSTAVTRSAVVDMARTLGYEPVPLSSSSGLAMFTITDNAPGAVEIPAGTQLTAGTGVAGEDRLIFETLEDLTITPPSINGAVAIVQGATIADEVVAVANGAAGQTYSLYWPNVDQDTVQIVVDSGGGPVYWRKLKTLVDAAPGDTVFSLFTDVNGVNYVRFGDGFHGSIPTAGATVFATYRISKGAAGNLAAGKVNALYKNIDFVKSVTNTIPLTGGEDAESLESIRLAAPKALQALTRAVTTADYATLALQVPGVAKASAEADVYTAVTLNIASTGGAVRTNQLLQLYGNNGGLAGTWGATIVTPKGSGTISGLAYDLSDATLQAALIATAAFDTGDVVVTGSAIGGTTTSFSYALEMTGDFAGLEVVTSCSTTPGDPNALPSVQFNLVAPQGAVTALLEQDLLDFFADKKMINTTLTISPATYVRVDISLTVEVLSNYSRDAVKTNVEAAVGKLLSFDRQDFGKTFTLSEVYHTVMEVEGVDWVVVDALHKSGLAGLSNTITFAVDEYPEAGEIDVTANGGVTEV